MSEQAAAERAEEKRNPAQPGDRKDMADAVRNVDGQKPFRQRMLPALALFLWMVSLPMSVCLFFMLCSVPLLWPLIVPYVIWIFFDTAPETGGRTVSWMRRLVLWRWLVKYFPASLIKVRVGCCMRGLTTDCGAAEGAPIPIRIPPAWDHWPRSGVVPGHRGRRL